MRIKLYHGTSTAINQPIRNRLYFTPSIKEAKTYAVNLNDLGEYSKEWFIYEIEVETDGAVEESDFATFDWMGYQQNCPDLVHNEETGWYIVAHPSLTLVRHEQDYELEVEDLPSYTEDEWKRKYE